MAKENWVLALCSLVTAVLVALQARGLWKLIPIFCGIVVGYIVTLIGYGMDLQLIYDAPWIGLPQFVSPEFSWRAILFIAPVAIALTKISDPKVFRIAAIAAILFSVVGKISALLKSIPSAVLGGIMLLLFGTIACAGISNMIVVSLTLTVGIGGAILNFGSFNCMQSRLE